MQATPSTTDPRYAKTIEASKKVRWDIERDIVRGRHFDLAHKFLPDGLSMVDDLADVLSAPQQRFLGQVQGRTYANMFGLVERFIWGLIGIASLLLSIILVLPVWGGNLLPAVAMGFFALGVMQRDGLAALLGWVFTGVTAAVVALAWKLVVASARLGFDWIAQLF